MYLDYHATTPVDPRVFEAMRPYFTEVSGTRLPAATSSGCARQSAVAKAREEVADLVGANAKEIVFTSGATEANNLAILGAARGTPRAGGARRRLVDRAPRRPGPLRRLEAEGFRVTLLNPDRLGRTSADAVAAALSDDTVLVTVMTANNEIGTLNPVPEIAGAVQGARRPLPHGCGASGREGADRRARLWRRPPLALGAQDLRAEGRGGALRPRLESARHAGPDPLRRRARARAEARNPRRAGRSSASAPRPRSRRPRARPSPRASRPCATGFSRGSSRASPAFPATATPHPVFPATSTCGSRARRRTP